MPYYTAVLARSGEGWTMRPADLDDAKDLDDIADAVRDATRGRGGLAVIEREDEWFALVRVDGDEDPRVLVSDLPAARQGMYAGVFEDLDEPGEGDDGDDEAARTGGTGRAAGERAADRLAEPADEASPDLGDRSVRDPDDEDEGPVGDEDFAGDVDDDGFEDQDEEDAPRSVTSGAGQVSAGFADPDERPAAPLADVAVWAGDLGLLDDAGVDGDELRTVLQSADPAAALQAIGRAAGFDEVLDAWH